MKPALFVKICGLRDPAALDAAIAAGADAVGFVFAQGSPRQLDADAARKLVARTPTELETVGVFRKQPIAEVLRIATAAGVTTVQLHGDEPAADFARLADEGFRTLRAISSQTYLRERSAGPEPTSTRQRLLIDAPSPGEGLRFDTTELAASAPAGFWLLAGGLTPDNIAAVLAAVSPSGVDVSSGVESSRGVKDAVLIRRFVMAARSVSATTPVVPMDSSTQTPLG
ncbi:phosphoribosylanthranilate isomerase [Rathayibacter soli]|uniref:phosphoribosylanthranilate isomerase n=1 Tax=Rathayibacter soli TaxID=3144168 RepID=UPI0027E3E9A7|nr:phosphoribosylanthranilate isomerase [Glaciibacter superstes]